MKKQICVYCLSVLLLLTLAACTDQKAEVDLTDYMISTGTYANGDKPFDDIPFIQYSIRVPSDWTAEEGGYWENEAYYTFYKDGTTSLYAGESYISDYMDGTMLSPESDVTTLAFGDYTAKLVVITYDDGCRYYFHIPVGQSYCQITGLSPEYSQEQQDEFFGIVQTFTIVG